MRESTTTTQAVKEEIIARMKDGGITRAQLRQMLGADKDSTARNFVTREIKPFYPVISSCHSKVIVIATKPEQIEMAKQCSREHHRKAATLHRNTNVLDKWIIKAEIEQTHASLFRDELNDITNYAKFKNYD